MTTRSKRHAATKSIAVVDLSDSEEEKPKRKRVKVNDDLDLSSTGAKPSKKPEKVIKRTARTIKKENAIKIEEGEDEVEKLIKVVKPRTRVTKRVNEHKLSDAEEDGAKPVKVVKPRGTARKKDSSSLKEEDKDDVDQLVKEVKPRARATRKITTSPKKPIVRKPRQTKQTSTKLIDTENQDPNSDEAQNDAVDGQSLSAGNRSHVRPSTSGGLNASFLARRKVWDIHELLAESENIDTFSARNIVQLFENENTIPFICRYRRDMIRPDITPEKLRDIKNTYMEIVALRKKAESIVTQLEKEVDIKEDVREEMLCAKTAEELEFLYAPYKPASKGSLADRAKALGLEVHADRLLNGESPPVRLETIVDRKNPDLDGVDKVADGICHIISHNFSKHTGVLEELRRLQRVHKIILKCTKAKVVTPKDEKASTSAAFTSSHGNRNDQSKYEQYFKFENDVRYVKPHQVLAINRGEKSKFLSVKIIMPEYFKVEIKRYISEIFLCDGINYPLRGQMFEKAFEECYTKKLVPLVSRQVRADLGEAAKKASIDVFAKNLKQLLLMSPLKGERILGIDPGFTNGCKLAVISETADVLEVGVVYPHSKRNNPDECGIQLAKMLIRNGCKIIALGNGTACRETEFWLTKLFEKGILDPEHVSYSIVSEQGASIYSCSEVAKKEFPELDMNVISAVSIARRLNDPLSEYVKIEPRHIGVGMYQHDINEKILSESLNEVVSECVSYVGVDINTASLSVLKHIAGLTEKRAEKIIQHRQENGPFLTRKDLLQVKSVGEKTFVQCAGFIRIEPKSVGGDVQNLLDCTWVHPESYSAAKKIIAKCKLNLKDIGKPDFILKIKDFHRSQPIETLAKEFGIPTERLQVVLEALQRQLFQDYRSDFDKKPLFKQGITRIDDLFIGEIVTGAVTNITHFGAFVDIGIECDGLIHVSKMNGIKLNLGDRVNTSVLDIDIPRRRVQLRLDELI